MSTRLPRLMTDDGEVSGLGEDEQRRFPRMQANCVVEVSFSQDHRRQRCYGRLTELSLGGGLLEFDVTYPVGSRLTLRFWLADHSDVLCTGIVRCLRDGQDDWQGHGLEFVDLSSLGLARLRRSGEASSRSRGLADPKRPRSLLTDPVRFSEGGDG